MKLKQLIEKIDKKVISDSSEVFDKSEYHAADEAIEAIIHLFPKNNTLEKVKVKVKIINTFYKTNVLAVDKLAEHITSIKGIDERIQKGDMSVVDAIRTGHGIGNSNSNDRNFYSFATKYCSFHNKEEYPIYDNLVKRLLYDINKKHKWFENEKNKNLTHDKLKEYENYKLLIDKLMKHYGITTTYKEVDKGLWIIAKYYTNKKKGQKQNNTKFDNWIADEVEKIIKNVFGKSN